MGLTADLAAAPVAGRSSPGGGGPGAAGGSQAESGATWPVIGCPAGQLSSES